MRLKRLLARIRITARAPILGYGVAVLSIILALIPALLLSDVVESRLVVFAVAIMVSAWYGGWRPGLVATAFAVTVSAYFSLTAARVATDYEKAIIHLTLFVLVALLICWFNAELRSAQQGLHRSESNFRSLVNHAPYGICRCNAAGILLEANAALASILGYGSSSELVGRNLANQYSDTQEWFNLADLLRTSKTFHGLVAQWACKDAGTVTVRVSGRAISGEKEGMFFELFVEDVTEQRELEQQLRQAQKMEAVGRLAGGIAHDFNNLLMVISGYSEFLLERIGSDATLRASVQEIANAAERATSLTRQLLAFSRKQMLNPKVLDLNAVLTHSVKMLTRMIGEDIHLVLKEGSSIGRVKADPGQIEQVIMNLAVNARDAMPHGGNLTIETSSITCDDEYVRQHAPLTVGDYVLLTITDTGVGMDKDVQSHIFEPFFTTKGLKGTGLGLSTVYGIVKQSGGYVQVASEPGKGATFWIYLPRVGAIEEAVGTETVVIPAKAEQALETILLVEDENSLRSLSRQYLEKQGYRVLEAPDAAAAISISNMHPGPVHLLLTDVIMPGMNGRELARRICESRPETRVLYMSGYSENAVAHNGVLEEGIALLQKPFTLSTLRMKVREKLTSVSRAKRFNLQIPLRYRPVGDDVWRKGTTENISRSGVLFRAQEMIQPQAELEIRLVLPPEITGLSTAEVLCRGEVVRTVQADQPTTNPALAAKILHFEFPHGPQQRAV
ncbi:MAG TPA: ATP-binding protein [Candidatus Sulfotelmatobacter sp.]|nr:ATP-binding protein [Candidatus Sulfotelmatobacter sp.]